MYHRIAEIASDPWQLAVSPANFAEQLQVLKDSGKVVSVNELVSALGKKSVPRNAICITFDDGYSDNYFSAMPLLETHNCAASFFITTRYVDQEQQFWWDELESIFLHTSKLPPIFSMFINGQQLTYKLGNGGALTPDDQLRHKAWVWPEKPPTDRCQIYLAIWERLKPLPYDHLQSSLQTIRLWAGINECISAESFPMKAGQISDILENSSLNIGIHTVTHPALSSHSYEIQHTEIAGSKDFLEKRFRRPMTTIAYPYGNYNHLTLDIVRELQLKAAFTTEERIITSGADPYRLGRFQVKNWNGEAFEKQLFEWMKGFKYMPG